MKLKVLEIFLYLACKMRYFPFIYLPLPPHILDHKEGSVLKDDAFKPVVLEKTLESPLDCQEIKPVNPKGNQPWLFTGRTDVEAAAPILWPPDVNSWLTVKYPGAGKDWGQEQSVKKDEMIGWHQWLNGPESEQTLRDSEGQGSLGCYSPWGWQELDTT